MKRGMSGGTVRGPVAHQRQRRTIRFMQGLLFLAAVALFAYAVVAFVHVLTFEQSAEVDASSGPTLMKPLVLVLAAVIAGAVAALLGGRDGVRLPTPARLEELAGRAERAVAERAEQSGAGEGTARRG